MVNCSVKAQPQDYLNRETHLKDLLEGQIATDSVDFINLLAAFATYGYRSLGDTLMIESKYASSIYLPGMIDDIRESETASLENVKAFLNSKTPNAIKFIADSDAFYDHLETINNKDDKELFDAIIKWIISKRTGVTAIIPVDYADADIIVQQPLDFTSRVQMMSHITDTIEDSTLRAKAAVFLDYISTGNINALIDKTEATDTDLVSKLSNAVNKQTRVPVQVRTKYIMEEGFTVAKHKVYMGEVLIGALQDPALFQHANTNELKQTYDKAVEMWGIEHVNKRLGEFGNAIAELYKTQKVGLDLVGLGKGNFTYNKKDTFLTGILLSDVHSEDYQKALPASLEIGKEVLIDWSKWRMIAGIKMSQKERKELSEFVEKIGGITELMNATEVPVVYEKINNSDSALFERMNAKKLPVVYEREYNALLRKYQQYYEENKSYLKPFVVYSFTGQKLNVPTITPNQSVSQYYESLLEFMDKRGRIMLDTPSFTFAELMKKFSTNSPIKQYIDELQESNEEEDKNVNRAKLGFAFVSSASTHKTLETMQSLVTSNRITVFNTKKDGVHRNSFAAAMTANVNSDSSKPKSILEMLKETIKEGNFNSKLGLSGIGKILSSSAAFKLKEDDEILTHLFSFLPLVKVDKKYTHALDYLFQELAEVNDDYKRFSNETLKGDKNITGYLFSKRASPANIINRMVVMKVGGKSTSNPIYDEQGVFVTIARRIGTETEAIFEIEKALKLDNKGVEMRYQANALLQKDSGKAAIRNQNSVGGFAIVESAKMAKLGIEYTVPSIPTEPNILLSVKESNSVAAERTTMETFQEIIKDKTVSDDTKEIVQQYIDANNTSDSARKAVKNMLSEEFDTLIPELCNLT